MSLRLLPWLMISLAMLMSGCTGPGKRPPQRQASEEIKPQPRPAADLVGSYSAQRVTGDYAGYPALTDFIDHLVSRHGMSRAYLSGLFCQAHRKQWTLDYLSKESGPGAATPRPGAWSRYQAKFLTEQHINGGVEFWRRHSRALQQASTRYGVPPEYILGIMGVETLFGRNVGSHRVLDALTTLAFDYPRRADYFRGELEQFLLMARAEGVDPSRPVGSYAGAMGLGQFMPSSFLSWAVDVNGDGRRDLWNAEDAIGSVANYFAEHGWRRGEPVVVPATASSGNVQNLETGYDTQYSLNTLAAKGIRPAVMVTGDEPLRLLRLRANRGDEYWLGHRNFYVITRYNHSTHYAMAVHQLAQAIRARYLDSRNAAR